MNEEYTETIQDFPEEQTERTKSWLLTQERAMEIYEFIQNSLEVTQWDLPIKSENFKKLTYEEFIIKAKKRIIFQPEFSNYNPSIVADDCINILESLPMTFEQMKNRMEDVFRSLLVVNEDMSTFIKDIEYDKQDFQNEIKRLSKENQDLRDELELTKIELQKKEAGITPLTDIIQIRIKEIIKLYQEFKNCIGKEEEMTKFLPIFEKEVDSTIKLIKLKEAQVLTSNLNPYKKTEEAPEPEQKTNKLTQKEEDIDETEYPDDDAFYEPDPEEDDPRPIRIKQSGYTIDEYIDAKDNVKKLKKWDEAQYLIELEKHMMGKREGSKWNK